MKNKKLVIGVIVIVIILVLFYVIYINKINKKVVEENNDIEFPEEGYESMLGGIENEQYYYKKQIEYRKLEQEEENLTEELIEKTFSQDEKQQLNEYREKMTDLLRNNNKQEKQRISNEYIERIQEMIENRCNETDKNKLKEIQNKKQEIEPIVEQYESLKTAERERRYKEGLEILSDGSISNKRENIINEKECKGLKFTNISLIYNPKEEKTVFKSIVTNVTQEDKEKQEITLKFSGDVEGEFKILVEPLVSEESMELEIPIFANITMANKFDIY